MCRDHSIDFLCYASFLQTPYSQLLGAATLTKLVNKGSVALTTEQRAEIKNYVLEYLGTRTKLQSYVQQALVQLYARITKIGWNDRVKDDFIFRTATDDLSKFLQVSNDEPKF